MAEKKESGRIPSAYREVEWVGFNLGAYLSTGIVPIDNPRVVTSVKVTDTAGTRRGLWSFGSSGAPGYRILNYYTSSNNVATIYGSNSSYAMPTPELRQTENWVTIDFSNVLKINGTKKKTYTRESFSENTKQIIIGKSHDYNGNYRFQTIKIYDGDDLKSELVPCYRKSDNKIGAYCLVRNIFLEGTGTLTKGADVT